MSWKFDYVPKIMQLRKVFIFYVDYSDMTTIKLSLKQHVFPIFLGSISLFVASCALAPHSKGKLMAVPEEKPRLLNERIMGEGLLSQNDLASFLLVTNGDIENDYAQELAINYIREARYEGVNSDIAFAQMCLETGYLRFGNLVTKEMNNFCGLGSIGGDQRGEVFQTVQLGVRAHIQHLKAYASTEDLVGELVDPRFKWVRRGLAPTFKGLAGTWAADPLYGEKIQSILLRMYKLVGQPISVPS